jgi:hypothetical protein
MPRYGNIIEGTFAAVIIFLVLTNARGFNTVATAIGNVYAQAVGALQGPERSANQGL